MESNPATIKLSDTKIMKAKNNKKISKTKKSKKPRCAFECCKKKLSFTDWACKCDKIFCQKHRSAPEHNCSYDWKSGHQEVLNNIMLGGKSIDTKNFVSI